MIRQVKGDLFESDVDIIAHQVNCMGVMGSGVAREVKLRFPVVFERYSKALEKDGANVCLGTAQFVEVRTPDDRMITVVNMFSQMFYGYDGKRYTSYSALRQCLHELGEYARTQKKKIGLPYKLGCVRGGGNWKFVYQIICEELQDCDVTLFELQE